MVLHRRATAGQIPAVPWHHGGYIRCRPGSRRLPDNPCEPWRGGDEE